ncbi:MAG: DUF2007 domain-containing protein [Candidatus Binataceae bacterium]
MSTAKATAVTEVLAAADPIRIRIARDVLAQAGIECFIFDEESYYLQHNVPVRLIVPADRREEALALLEKLDLC